jgi:hypothetical protein
MSSASAGHSPATRPSQPGEPPWDVALLYPLQGSWTEDVFASGAGKGISRV